MTASATAKRNKAYGPYEVINEVRGQGRNFLTLDFNEVIGCRLLITVTDNWASFIGGAEGIPNKLWPTAEVTIWGVIQGTEVVIKRQQVRQITGPMEYVFSFEDCWDEIHLKARNISGGNTDQNQGSPPFAIGPNGYSLQVSASVKPRSGFAAPHAQNDGQSKLKVG